MTSIACVGEAMIEISPSAGGHAKLGVAGDTLNTAIYLKRSAPELSVDYITRLGVDPFSERIRGAISDEDIGTHKIETEAGGTPGLYAITTAEDGERSFTYWRSDSAARRMFQTDHAADFSALHGYDMVYLSGITLAILPEAIRQGLLEYLSANAIPFAFDSNYRPKLWESDQAAQAACLAYFTNAAIALPSLDDEMALWGETEDAAIARLLGLPGQGAIKRGRHGPVSIGSPVDQSYDPAPCVVDTTAAGDSFNAGYLAAILTGQDQAASLMAGHTCAREVVQHPGAILPRKS